MNYLLAFLHAFFHAFGYSAFTYKWPIRPRQCKSPRYWENTESHVGKDANALDIFTPDPIINPLPVWVPRDGTIIALKQDSETWGDTKDFEDYLNYVIVQVSPTEFYMCAHIAANSCPYKVGDKVKVGQQLATTGVNGWMMNVEHHHFMVAKVVGNSYESVRIRWDEEQEYAPAKT